MDVITYQRSSRLTAVRRILFIDHTARMGGGEIALFNLARSIDRARYEPVVLLFEDGPLREKLDAAGVATRVLPLAGEVGDVRKDSLGGNAFLKLRLLARTLAFAWRVRAAIRESRPAIVHTNSLKSDVIGGLASRMAGVPVVWHVRDRIANDYLPRAAVFVFRWMAGWLPVVVIANSRATLATLKPTTPGLAIPSGIDDAAWSVIHDGIAPEAQPNADAPDANVERCQIVGLVGRLARWKGQHIFIEAAGRLRERFPHARFQIIGAALFGEDAFERELRAQVTRDGLDGVVEFSGFRADVGAAIAALDVLVHASITGEPFGQVIVEGMIAGKPVVATDGGGVPEIVVEGETGLLVPMGDSAAMAEAIARMLGDADLRARMGRAGQKHVLEHFTIQRTAERVQAVYDNILAGQRGHA